MARYRNYNYNQLMLIPVSLEEQLVPGTLEYAIHHLIEERIDTSYFDEQGRVPNDLNMRQLYCSYVVQEKRSQKQVFRQSRWAEHFSVDKLSSLSYIVRHENKYPYNQARQR